MTAASAPMPTEISSAELALLALSNPREVSLGTKSPIALTTKESYLWALFLATLAEGELVIQSAQLVNTIHEEMKIHQVEQMLPSAGTMTDSPQSSILKRVAERLLSPPPADVDIWFDGLDHNADQTYRSLVAKGLIEDPFSVVLGGIAVVVLGLTPVHFTRQTQAGEQVLIRIKSLFYQYEKSRKDKTDSVNIRFHLFSLIKAFTAAASSGFTKVWESIQIDHDLNDSDDSAR
jgi:hypothetical protein